MRLAVLGATLVLALPGTALAATPTNPLTPGLPASPVQTQTATTPAITLGGTTAATDTGLSGTGAIAIAVGAMLVLGGISFYIWRDARRRAPVRHRVAEAGAGGRAGSKTRAKQRKLSPAERRRRKRGRAR